MIARILATSLVFSTFAVVAAADETAEKYIDDAMPLMYHTCTSVVEEANGDSDYVENVVRALVAVSLYNREIDIAEHAKSAEDKAALHVRFVEAVGNGCKADKEALLAGVIDGAVVQSLASKK